MIVSCHTPDCNCIHDLYAISGDFRGHVSIKCQSCNTIHDFDHDSTQPATQDLRCPSHFVSVAADRDGRKGGWCGQLVMRVSVDMAGTVWYRCPRCTQSRSLRIDTPAMSIST